MSTYFGRYAPSPSGDMHVGNLRTAVVAWLRSGGRLALRIDDIDAQRSTPQAADQQVEDLWLLGLRFEAGGGAAGAQVGAVRSAGAAASGAVGVRAEGGVAGGVRAEGGVAGGVRAEGGVAGGVRAAGGGSGSIGGGVVRQQETLPHYQAALDKLQRMGLVYPCFCSRKDIQEASRAPHGAPGSYPGTCRDLSPEQVKQRTEELAQAGRVPALRLRAGVQQWQVQELFAIQPGLDGCGLGGDASVIGSAAGAAGSDGCGSGGDASVIGAVAGVAGLDGCGPGGDASVIRSAAGVAGDPYVGPVDDMVLRRGGNVLPGCAPGEDGDDGAGGHAHDYAYNLAVVVDDALAGVEEVVRGDDLLSSAPRQAYLAHLLGVPEVHYVHIPLVLGPTGQRLAKRDGAVTLGDIARSAVTGGPTAQWDTKRGAVRDDAERLRDDARTVENEVLGDHTLGVVTGGLAERRDCARALAAARVLDWILSTLGPRVAELVSSTEGPQLTRDSQSTSLSEHAEGLPEHAEGPAESVEGPAEPAALPGDTSLEESVLFTDLEHCTASQLRERRELIVQRNQRLLDAALRVFELSDLPHEPVQWSEL